MSTTEGYPFGLDHEWDLTDHGDEMIYSVNPAEVPPAFTARVIYELRKDCDRLNTEAVNALSEVERLKARVRFLLAGMGDAAKLLGQTIPDMTPDEKAEFDRGFNEANS